MDGSSVDFNQRGIVRLAKSIRNLYRTFLLLNSSCNTKLSSSYKNKYTLIPIHKKKVSFIIFVTLKILALLLKITTVVWSVYLFKFIPNAVAKCE